MAKRKAPSVKKNYKDHKKRLKKYVKSIEQFLIGLSSDFCKRVRFTGDYTNVDEVKEYVSRLIKEGKKKLTTDYINGVANIVRIGSSTEWEQSEKNVDRLIDAMEQSKTIVPPSWIAEYKKHNESAMKAFINRVDDNGGLISKLQKQSLHYSNLLGESIASAIAKGLSAVSLAKQVEDYLYDTKSLLGDYKAYIGDDGTAIDVKYTAMRLARTEINSAYKIAEEKRYNNLDFVVGYEVHRSGELDVGEDGNKPLKHDCDLCESLKGNYPKDFVFTGWHPNCLCYITPILNTSDEFWSWNGKGEPPKSVNEVTDVPNAFKDYVETNTEKIESANGSNSLPYFLRYNSKYVNESLEEGAKHIGYKQIVPTIIK